MFARAGRENNPFFLEESENLQLAEQLELDLKDNVAVSRMT